MDYSPPSSSVHGIFQARIVECVAIPFSRGSSPSRDQTQGSCTVGRFFTVRATREAWFSGNHLFLFGSLVYDKVKWSESHSVMSNSLWPHGLHSPWNSPGQNTGVGSLSFLQGIFPTQGLNPGLPHCRQILYQLSHKGSPRIPEWVAYPFSNGSSRPRNRTGVSCIAGGFFTNWAMREAPVYDKDSYKLKRKSFFLKTESVIRSFYHMRGVAWSLSSKEFACNAGDLGLIPGSGRSPGERNGYSLQCSCLEKCMDRRAWWATVHGVSKSQTGLSDKH